MTDQLSASFVSEIEQEVLGALLIGGDVRDVSDLKPDFFVADIHRLLFGTIREAHERFGSTAPAVVQRALPSEAQALFLNRTGRSPLGYMMDLQGATIYGKGGLKRTGAAVVEQWGRLRVGELGQQLAVAAADAAANPTKIIKTIAADLDDVASALRSGRRRHTLYTMDTATKEALVDVQDAMARGNGLTGHTWGLTDINSTTGGIHPGEMAVIGARPAMGKTALALSVALRCAATGVGVGIISLEMGAKKLALRRLTDVGYDWGVKVPYTDLIKGTVSQKDLDALVAANQDADNLPLWIEEQSGLTITDIRVRIERMAEMARARGVALGVLIIDYLQLVRPSSRYAGNRVGEITEISWSLREFGREFGIGIIALSQLSRGVESRDDKRPSLADLRDSGAIEQDADMVAFLYREAYYLEKAKGKDPDKEADRVNRLIDCQNELEFIIAKQRNGPARTVKLFVDIACSAVRSAARV